ncbi:hypothetical protein TVAG_285100 [Trichomonas vaginalis G3]|uniref:Uncharacterized protein n=1 Tax=Trichomonas vaginalis (strain ATCC PRA-98 / G3) TaxID=412133 RepID=A2G4P0_TRIV3|nr:protein ubiquitination [Trichomonas vaginalis G3]EAX87885.1 hypothetical protein TVAG_285100 [Trichomonas vaginalis G3]KAI5518576.1 protein ubiquitination [Trichomonas vaginalis G3]|eukprot:XP_001300815.1 hypothetical protein [Trichomonas vaginalis G3]
MIVLKSPEFINDIAIKVQQEEGGRVTSYKLAPFNLFYASHKLRNEFIGKYIEDPIHIGTISDKESFKKFLELMYNKETHVSKEQLIQIIKFAKDLEASIFYPCLIDACSNSGLYSEQRELEDLNEKYKNQIDPKDINLYADNINDVLESMPEVKRCQAILQMNLETLQKIDRAKFNYPLLDTIYNLQQQLEDRAIQEQTVQTQFESISESESDTEAKMADVYKDDSNIPIQNKVIHEDDDYNTVEEKEDFPPKPPARKKPILNPNELRKESEDIQKHPKQFVQDEIIPLDYSLERAIRKNNLTEFKALIKLNKKQINAQNQNNQLQGPIHLAAINDRLDIMIEILQHPDVNVNLQDSQKKTALFHAIENKRVQIIDRLLKDERVDLEAQMKDGRTVMHLIVEKEDFTTLRKIARKGNIEKLLAIKDNLGNSPFHYCILKGKEKSLDELEKIMPEYDVNDQNKEGLTMLHLAAALRRTTLLIRLLENPTIDVNIQDNKSKTAAFTAGDNQNFEEFKEIVKKDDYDIDAKSEKGLTLFLYLVLNKKDYKFIEFLLEEKPDVIKQQDELGRTALHIMISTKNLEMFNTFIEHPGVDQILNMVDRDKRTPLHIAAINNENPDYVERLVKFNKLDKNARDVTNKTAYEYAKTKKIQSILMKYTNIN